MNDACIVAAPGPSLEVGPFGLPVIAVGDAHRLLPGAIACVQSDVSWWRMYAATVTMRRVIPGGDHLDVEDCRNLDAWGVERVALEHGPCSGYAAIQFALQEGFRRIMLVGFDMRVVDGATHFYGRRRDGLRDPGEYQAFLPAFEQLAKRLPPGVQVLNATASSALRCFPFVDFDTGGDLLTPRAVGAWRPPGPARDAHYPAAASVQRWPLI